MDVKDYKIKHFKDVPKDDWDNFVYSSSMGWAYFLHDVIAIHRWKSYVNESFAIISEQNEILMVVQLHITPEKTMLSQWGFCIKDNLSKRQNRLVKQKFHEHIEYLISRHNILSYSASLPPLTAANSPDKCNMVNPLMYFNFVPQIKYTYVVDLSKTDDRMLADCEETTRQAIRKYDTLDKYTVIESNGTEDDCQRYIKLHKETYTRTNTEHAIIDDEYNEYIFKKLVPQKRCRVFFLEEIETGEYIAAVVILLYKNTAFYWWGASKNEKDIGINKYLLFKAICSVRESFEKNGYFETGFAYPYLKSGKFKGLNDYKKCFGTFIYPIFDGTYQMPAREIKHKTINLLGIKIKYKCKA